jgi:flagella basal body P-ring formation protein FlgA
VQPAIDASLESPTPLGRVTVKVRCEARPVDVFVPAQVRLLRDVVVVTRPLKRDSMVGEGDVALRERDVGTLGQGYLTRWTRPSGMKLLRPTVIDQVLTLQHLEQAEVVRKGDQVVIIARSGTLSVRMPGEALSKGGLRNRSGYATSTPSAWSRPGSPGPGRGSM